MEWREVDRPGFFGKERDKKIKEFNEIYGDGNWKLAHKFNGKILDFLDACAIYERAYFVDSFQREDLWKKLVQTASEVYDHHPSNINSGFDYTKQEREATHLQDISIRKVVFERGWKFEGKEPIQIRSHNTFWGRCLSPGKVLFHVPQEIIRPSIESWWDRNTIEDFWQNNKYLYVKREE